MKWIQRATALLLACLLSLLCLASCEGASDPVEAKAVFAAIERTVSDSDVKKSAHVKLAEAAMENGSLAFTFSSPNFLRSEEASPAAHWQVNFREGEPSHLAFEQGERSFALWLEGNTLIALPHGEEAVATDLSKIPDDPIPAGTLSLGTEAAEETLSFWKLARDLLISTVEDPLFTDELAAAMQKNASIGKSSEKAGMQYDFLFTETTLGNLFADVAPLAKENATLAYAITALSEQVYAEYDEEVPENLFSDEGVARVKEDLKSHGTLSMLARFVLKNEKLAALRIVLRRNQTEVFHLNVSLTDLENGTAEIFAINKAGTLDRKIAWTSESGRETVRTVRVSERAQGYSEYSPIFSLDTQYNPKNGNVKINASTGGLLGFGAEGSLTVEHGSLHLAFDGFQVYYGFLSQTFAATLDLTLSTAPAEAPKAPEHPREWTTLTAEEIGNVFVGLYPLLRAEESSSLEGLLPSLEDILGNLLPI